MGSSNRRIASIRRGVERRLDQSRLIVVLLGSSGKGLDERREIARRLGRSGMIALVPEDDFPAEIGPSVVETAILTRADVDLVFLNVESWGTATEFGQFSRDPNIATKLRVLVRPEFHPVHGPAAGYLKDMYLTHLVSYGHVYPVDGGRQVPVPPATSLVPMLAERHRELKAFQGVFTK